MKAAEKLSASSCIAGGQAYNISDDNPMEPYEFIRYFASYAVKRHILVHLQSIHTVPYNVHILFISID